MYLIARIILLLSLFLCPLLISIQDASAAGRTVAAVFSADLPRYREAHRAFEKQLQQKGYTRGNLDIIEQFPNADPISWANAVRKFVGLNADLIVAYGAPAAMAASKEGGNIPILVADVYGPVEIGIATSMTRSGSNLTGVSSKVPLITLLKMIQEIKLVRTIGIIYSSREAGSLVQLKELRRASAQLGISVEELNATTAAGFDAAVTSLVRKVDSVLVTENTVSQWHFDKIIKKTNDARIPLLTMIPDAAERGALISLEISPVEQGQLAAELASRILGGAKAGALPLVMPKRVELLINMKSARYLDLQVPFSVLSNATKIIK